MIEQQTLCLLICLIFIVRIERICQDANDGKKKKTIQSKNKRAFVFLQCQILDLAIRNKTSGKKFQNQQNNIFGQNGEST